MGEAEEGADDEGGEEECNASLKRDTIT